MELDLLLITNGLTCLVLSIVSIIIGLKIASKYFEHKIRILLLAGLTWLFMSEPWWGPSISFILILVSGQSLPDELFFIISISFIPVAITLWTLAFTDLVYKKNEKLILVLLLIHVILFEIFTLYYLFTDSSVIMERVGIIDAEYKSFVLVYLIILECLLIITGPLFARESIKSDNPEVKLKGKFLLTGFLAFIIGSIFDVILELNFITLLIYRSILILSSIAFYFGFFLPKRLKELFLA